MDNKVDYKQSYVEGSCGNAGSYRVNVRTGRLDFTKQLIALDGSLMPLNFSLSYNCSYSGPFFVKDFPICWKLNVMQYVYADEKDDVYYYIDKDYRTHLFKKLSSNLYYDTSHTGLLLNVNDTNITIFDDAGSELVFTNGYLTIIREVHGTTPIETKINYDEETNRLISVTDGMGRTATLEYNTGNITITCPNGEKIKLIIDLTLNGITEITGETHSYAYVFSGDAVRLAKCVSEYGGSIEFSYDSTQIKSISEKFNQNAIIDYEFTYHSYHTLVKTYKNKATWTEPRTIQAYQFAEDQSTISLSEVNDDDEIINPIYKSQDDYDNNILSTRSTNVAMGKVSGNTTFSSPAAGQFFLGTLEGDESIDIDDELAFYATVSGSTQTELNTNKITLGVIIPSLGTLASIEFHSVCMFTQTNASRFHLSYWKEELKDELVGNKLALSKLTFFVRADNGAGISTISNVHISKIKNTGTISCIREGITGPKIKMATSSGEDTWTKLTSCKLEGVSDCEKITANDWAYNQRALAKNKNIIWYNDLSAAMVGDGTASVVVNGSVKKTISTFLFGTVTFQRQTAVFEYVTYSNLLATLTQNKVRNGVSKVSTTQLDEYQRIKIEKNFENTKSEYKYDDYGRHVGTTITSSSGNKITNSYTYQVPDSGIYKETKTDSANNKWSNSHQLSTGSVTSAFDPKSNGVNYTYDDASRLTGVSSTASTSTKNTITYSKGNVSSLKHSGAKFDYTYDTHGMISTIQVGGTPLYTTEHIIQSNGYEYFSITHGEFEQYYYDKFGRMVSHQCGNEMVKYIYGAITDDVSNITSYSDSRLHINTTSKLRKTIDGKKTKTYYYDSYGELIHVVCSDGIKCNFQVDEYGRASMEKYDFGSKYYASNYSYYDADSLTPDRLRNVTLESKEEIVALNYSYDTLGRLTKTNLSYLDFNELKSVDIMSQSYSYNTNAPERVASLTFKNKNGQTTETLNYGYDVNGNITSMNTVHYTYDALNRLTREDNPSFNTSYVYAYDAGGNITSKKEYAYTTGTLGIVKKTYMYTYGNSKWKDQLTAWNGKAFTYDKIGRPTNYKGNALSWDRNRIKKFGDTEFTYDGEGYLTGIKTTTTSAGITIFTSETCRYENGKLLKFNRELKVNGSSEPSSEMYFLYNGNEVIGIVYNGEHYYYRKNLQGDILGIVKLDGTEVATYAYDAWGNCMITKSSGIAIDNPFRYRGYFYDAITGLYYLINRFYDPETGRFVSPDEFAYLEPKSLNGLNLYAYCLNNPVMNVDPSGQSVIGAIFTIVTVVASLAALANDIYQIASKKVYVDLKNTNSENVAIKNSYKIITGLARFVYAFYLNHINKDTKDIIKGSTAGVMCEWELHNYAAWLGFGGDSARDLDIGSTIFSDGESHPLIDKGEISTAGIMSIGMRVWYILTGNPIYWIYDLIVNGGF